MVFSQFVYKMYQFSLTKKKKKKKKKYALHLKCSYLYTNHTRKRYRKLKINSCLNGESPDNLRREESRSPLALPELRLYLTRRCRCYRRVTRNDVIPRIRTQSVPSFICRNTHRQSKRLFISCHTNL